MLSPDVLNVRAGKVSVEEPACQCNQHPVLRRTYGRSAGSEPNLSFNLLCTTKIANFVRCASRSDSGNSRSSFSTSFWSSETAYLIGTCQMIIIAIDKEH